MVVVALGELRGGCIVDDEGDLGMELKGRGGDRGSDRAFDRFRDGRGLGRAGGEQKDLPRFQDRADPHGDGATRTLIAGREGFRVVVKRFLAQDLQARARADTGSGLIKTDMAVAANSQKLDSNSSGLANGFFIAGAVLIIVVANGSIGNVDVL